ncbi:Pfs, NACHT and ankyrin domain protein [Xylaria arbuscula]|nr:Pfs, NACHT and ankyrin domain protein [Xylaria arbuscula]
MATRTALGSPDLYTVGWITALHIERAAATAMLDERHDEPHGFSQHASDMNSYTWGRMGKHNIVIASLAAGLYGTISAATTASSLLSSLPQIRIGLLVGIGAGIATPDGGPDIRLGDIVVSMPDGATGGVVQYDLTKAKPGNTRERKDFLNMPPPVFLHALANLQADHHISPPRVSDILEEMGKANPRMVKSTKSNPGFVHQGFENDRLFKPSCDHTGGRDCRGCDPKEEIQRYSRDSIDPEIHYGLIASGNTLVKDAATRSRIVDHVGGGCLCIEMEAAGLMNHFPCLVVRGICDYADSHKNDQWQPYASATAAAFGKELLSYVPVKNLQETRRATERLESIETKVREIHDIANNNKNIKILNWFSKLSSQEKHKDVLKEHQEGTGRFLLDSQKFIDWRNGKDRILWCIGAPGTGKTVLASIVINTLGEKSASSKEGIAFLYCVYAERNDQSIEQIIGSIIQQLLRQQNAIPAKVLEKYDLHSHANTRPDLTELSECLDYIISQFSKIYIVVDAIDECDEISKTRTTLLSLLQSLDIRVQLLFTSRPLVDILPDAVRFEVTAQKDDIHKYLSAQIELESNLAELCAKHGSLERDIIDKITAKAGGVFLMARLHLRSVAGELRLGTVRSALETLPIKLDEVYGATAERIRSGQQQACSNLAMTMLMLLSYSLEPLKLGGVQHALLTMETKQGDTNIDRNDLYPEGLLIPICCGLVVLEEGTSTVRFVHHTVETYFESEREKLFDNAQVTFTKTC